jgi:hypothetical protein
MKTMSNEHARNGALFQAHLTPSAWKRGDPVPAGFKVRYEQQPPHQSTKEMRRRQRQMGLLKADS